MPGLPTKIANALMKARYLLLPSLVVSAIALPQLSSAFDGNSGERRIMLAQKEDPKKKKEQPKKEAPKKEIPKQQQKQGGGGQPPAGVPKQTDQPPAGVPKQTGQPPAGVPKQTGQPPAGVPKQTGQPPKGKEQQGGGQPQDGGQPKALPKVIGKPKDEQPKDGLRKDGLRKDGQPKDGKQPLVKQQGQGAPQTGKQPDPKLVPKETGKPQFKRVPMETVQPKESGTPKQFGKPKESEPKTQQFGQPKARPGAKFDNVKDIRSKRKETKDKSGRIVIIEPGNRRIIRDGKRTVILRDDSERMRRWGNARFELRGQERYTTVRRGSFEVVTVTDSNGRLLRRFRRGPDGREYVLIDNRRRNIGIGVGAAAVGIVALGLMAPRITIPRDRYIVEGGAPPALLYETLEAPPEAPLERAYTFDEIRDNVELRDYVRSIDINTINFSSGSWEIPPEQIPQLEALAEAMLKVIGENPDSVFLLEGHTDAVGPPEDNLSLSDRRAETVAEILTTNFQVPPENLMTQGYGEQHLRVQTDGPSRENRRVQVRNITALLAGK